MHISLLHERFIFRYGVDRVLLCLAKEFKNLGHRVTLIGQKFDEEWQPDQAIQLVRIPNFEPYIESDLRAARWLQENWKGIFSEGNKPDVALVGGWPFFQTMGLLKSKGVKVWFQDYGIAPEEGFGEGHAQTINLLRLLKERFCCFADGIAPISDFIKKSQSNQVSSNNQPVEVVLLGADHAKILKNKKLKKADSKGKVKIFSIGRFEPGVYKQSEQVFELAQALKNRALLFEIKVLAPMNINIPAGLNKVVFPTGYLGDQEMFELMADSTLCVCFSRWEGFNLNLAESQALQIPCFVYNCAAHPEVVADSWFLCNSIDEMSGKIENLIKQNTPKNIQNNECLKNYAENRSWNQTAAHFIKLFKAGLSQHAIKKTGYFDRKNSLLVEVGNSCRDPANSGVVRVTRQLSARLSNCFEVIFVCWDDDLCDLRFPTVEELNQLSAFGGPTASNWQPVSNSHAHPSLIWDFFCASEPLNGWLLLPEIKQPHAIKSMTRQSRRWGLRAAAIFYDAIAVVRPDLVKDPRYREPHLQYMIALSDCDVVIPISDSSASDLAQIWKKNGVDGSISTVLLPGGFVGARPLESESGAHGNIALCVSTIEPRKNHLRLLEAFRLYKKRNPKSNLKLVLVGNRYAGAEDLVSMVEAAAASSKDIEWRGIVSDEELWGLYSQSVFTVYPSEIEGFGLPIVESLWHGIPCICHREGVMAEIAKGGGCLTADVCSIESLADSFRELDTNKELRSLLSKQARERELKTWENYTQEILGVLSLFGSRTKNEQEKIIINDNKNSSDWKKIIFGESLHDEWQMSESEKAGLLAILATIKPRLAIEIGTYKGGSLSLIRQHAKAVISMDIDPNVAEKFGWMKNVQFLTGDSKKILPMLLSELEAKAVTPDFILVDGDHSSEGVLLDMQNLLSMKPRNPCFILMHDMANPICRSGANRVDWEKYKNVDHVDLDFIPGRIIENGSQSDGEIWGGLGLVVLLPQERQRKLRAISTCSKMLEYLWERKELSKQK